MCSGSVRHASRTGSSPASTLPLSPPTHGFASCDLIAPGPGDVVVTQTDTDPCSWHGEGTGPHDVRTGARPTWPRFTASHPPTLRNRSEKGGSCSPAVALVSALAAAGRGGQVELWRAGRQLFPSPSGRGRTSSWENRRIPSREPLLRRRRSPQSSVHPGLPGACADVVRASSLSLESRVWNGDPDDRSAPPRIAGSFGTTSTIPSLLIYPETPASARP